MINKFEIVDLLEISSSSDIESREKYKFNIDPKNTKLEEIIAPYDIQNEEVHCGLSSCHQPHHMGYLVKTADGYETNIGNYCGRKHFGADFSIQKNILLAEYKLQNYRKLLNELIYNSDDVFQRINQLRESGANWLNKSVKNFRRLFPNNVVEELQSRAERENSQVYEERKRNKKELEVAIAANPNENVEALIYVREYVGKLNGLFIFTRNIRDVLVIDIENKLKDLLKLDPDTSGNKLKNWYEWAQNIDDLFAEAELLIEEGRRFFVKDNLLLVRNYIAGDNDRSIIDNIIWDYGTGEGREKIVGKKQSKRL